MSSKADQRLANIVNGKRVVIVGPSPHLVGQGLGTLINSYDVVARVNDPFPKGREVDYGSRTDVLFHSCSTLYLKNLKRKFEQSEITKQIKLVYCPAIKAQHDGNGDVGTNFNSVNVHGLSFVRIAIEDYQRFKRKFGCEPNMGQLTLALLLTFPIRELQIFGFTFYAQYKDDGYGACYYDWDEYLPEKKYPNTSNPLIGHNQPPQIQHFINHVWADPRVNIDSVLASILSLPPQLRVYNING